MNNLIFVGGIHGAGKHTICSIICQQTNLIHLTASEILKWDEISQPSNKKVENIQDTQYRLISGLNKVLKKKEAYLLDGHFCLFNSKGDIERVPMETFKKIAPKLIVVVTANVELVKSRLTERDGMNYNLALLNSMQTSEKEYARQISLKLKVPFMEVKDGNYQSLIKFLS